MSTTGPLDSTTHSAQVPLGPSSALPSDTETAAIDPILVQQTKNEIRSLVNEITQLSQANVPVTEFYEQFLTRVVQALASHGGAIWTASDDGTLRLEYQANLPREDLVDDEQKQNRHGRLLQNVLQSGQPTLVPPQSGGTVDDEAANPSDFLLVLACLRVEQETLGVIEIFQRAGGGPTTQRGYLRFLVQMAELASDYFKNRHLRILGDRQSLWEQLEGFIRATHRELDSKATAYTVVNESRRLIQCDRVSIALREGRRLNVKAVSGLDTIDRRAAEIRQLGRLATAVTAARRPLWYKGDRHDLPPQIDGPLHDYLDQSHSKLLGVIPLYRPQDEADDEQAAITSEPLGALIVEQLADSRINEGLIERTEIVAAHSSAALANALEHEGLFLMPLWKTLGKAKWIVQARTLPKTIAVLAVIAAAITALVLVPADFDLAAKGKLQPAVRREVFAPLDGVVIDVPVRHEDEVSPGAVLARLANNELDVQIANLLGRKRRTQERIVSLSRAQFDQRLTVEQANQIAGEQLELAQTAESTERELALLRQQRDALILRSEMAGQVVTWDVGGTFLRRPIQRGQILMTVVDPSGDWELELYMPEKRMGHLAAALADAERELKVVFMLASHPGKEFDGRVVDLHRVAEVRGEEGNTVLVRVAIDKSTLPELRSETTVTAKVRCGKRSVGFVVFHELIETIHTKLLFWF